MDSIRIPETPLSPSHPIGSQLGFKNFYATSLQNPIVVTAINAGLSLETDDAEERYRNCIIPPYCPVFIKRAGHSAGDLPMVVANTESITDAEWVFFGISFTSTLMVRILVLERQLNFVLIRLVQGDAQVLAETRPPADKWPRIAVLVGGSITVASASNDLQASDPIKFVASGHKEVEGIRGLEIAVPQKWEPEDQFEQALVDGNENTNDLIIVSNSDGQLKYKQKEKHVKIAAICLDIDAKREMRILLK